MAVVRGGGAERDDGSIGVAATVGRDDREDFGDRGFGLGLKFEVDGGVDREATLEQQRARSSRVSPNCGLSRNHCFTSSTK
ncbi:MAG: hypothetical protein R2695_22125 [Acidimicrobiales bacterium]